MADFTDNELAYLNSQRLGRLATVGADGAPHVVPVGFHYNSALATIDVGGHAFGATRKFRDVQHEHRVSLVVDDLASTDPWTPRGIEVRGTAEALTYGGESLGSGYSAEMIRIYPRRIVEWGIESHAIGGAHARAVHL